MQIKCSNLNFYLRNRKSARELTPIRCCCTVFAIVLAKLGGKTRNKKISFRFVFSFVFVCTSSSFDSIYTFFPILFMATEHCSLSFVRRLLLQFQQNFNSSHSIATISISTLASILVWIFGFTVRFIPLRRFDSNSVSTLPNEKKTWMNNKMLHANKQNSID